MKAIRLSAADFVTSKWSGGTTTQLLIEPPGAKYSERAFLWRISSAAVSLRESVFTSLPDYDRFIAAIEGGMTLSHDGGAPTELFPGTVHRFSGAADTHSVGCCTDFNLMLRKGMADGTMRAVRAGTQAAEIKLEAKAEQALVFPAGEGCTVLAGGAEYPLDRGECLLLSELRGAELPEIRIASSEPDALVMLCQMWRL